ELGITGRVKHTEQWNLNRLQYNFAMGGDQDTPRPYNVYWSGEKFILEADTTNTGDSTTKAQSVTVEVLGTHLSTNLTSSNHISWLGDIVTEANEILEDGPYDFNFTVTYSNGIQKTDTVRIYIQ